MKLITRVTDYAIRSLCYIAQYKNRKEGIVSVRELARQLKLPRPFLRKILQELQKKGLLSSSRGQGGGFRLAKEADKIFILDLVEIFQGPLKINECLLMKIGCPDEDSCLLKKRVDRIEKYILEELKSITIASLSS